MYKYVAIEPTMAVDNETNCVDHFRSFAYHTVQERLPIILTKIIDQTTRDREELAELYDGEVILNRIV